MSLELALEMGTRDQQRVTFAMRTLVAEFANTLKADVELARVLLSFADLSQSANSMDKATIKRLHVKLSIV